MGLSEILELLKSSHSVEDAIAAYHRSKADLERQRREMFRPFGHGPEQSCPAARVYHSQSTITPGWTPLLTPEESSAHARSLDYKRYPGAPHVPLEAAQVVDMPPGDAILRRRSRTGFEESTIALEDLGTVLRWSCGVTRRSSLPLRAAPSAGGLYPVETYVLPYSVDGLETALYHYANLDHELERVGSLPPRKTFSTEVLAPGLVDATPSVILALTAVLARVEDKYGERGYRFALLEAGHIAQNLSLVATALGLKSNCVGGFCDHEINAILELDERVEVALYLFLLGR